jgi:hypothetical protein
VPGSSNRPADRVCGLQSATDQPIGERASDQAGRIIAPYALGAILFFLFSLSLLRFPCDKLFDKLLSGNTYFAQVQAIFTPKLHHFTSTR